MRRPTSVLGVALLLLVVEVMPLLAGTLDVTPDATWTGDFGLEAVLNNADPAYVETATPDDETRYVVRFYFLADALTLGGAGSIVLFQALSSAPAVIVTVRLQSDGGAGRQLVYTVDTDSADASTPTIPVAPGWHFLELDWGAATAPGANNGFLLTRLDDVPTAGLSTLDNDQSTITLARWGAVGLSSSPGGTLWADDFASRRTGPIGPVLAGSLDLDGDGTVQALTDGLLALRALFGFTGSTLTNGAVGAGCKHCTGVALQPRLGALAAVLDIDDDGSLQALTDGLLILRFLFGFTGATLTNGAIGFGAQRTTPEAIATYLASLE